MNKKIMFLGAGKMASAIAGGLVKRSAENSENIYAFDVNCKAAAAFFNATGVKNICSDAPETFLTCADIVLLAVKPQYLADAVKMCGGVKLLQNKFIISIVAGVPIARLRELTGAEKIVRVMPNTPALIGEGASAYAAENLTDADLEIVQYILSAIGIAKPVNEPLLNAVTGLSGSGPAYVFEFIMALADGGVQEGLPRDLAQELAVQTVIGAAKLVQETGKHPAVLRDEVISPGGTTARGVAELDKHAFRSCVAGAVIQAAKRSEELGKTK